MNEQMEFEKTFEEFLEIFSFKDTDRVYTNGIELIPTYRVMQGWEHYRKQIRLEVLNPIAKLIDDFACEREETVLQAISEYIYEQTKGNK